MARKQVLVQLTDELVSKLDELGEQIGRSRSAIVRDAVERYVIRESAAEKDRRLVEGYKRFPDDEFTEWAEDALREMLEEESW